MNILELDSYNLADAVKFHDRLNPRLWDNREHLRPKVHAKLMAIAREFQEFLGVPDLDVVDITISGSNAAYNYTPNSDIDLHLVVRIPDVKHSEVYRELFNAKKYEFNDAHDITIGGADVELYVQDSEQAHHSQGIYSLLNNDWVSVPKRHKATIDDACVRDKVADLDARIHAAVRTNDSQTIDALCKKIKSFRQAGLEQQGEFGCDNLAFKILRNSGCIKALWTARDAARDAELSLPEDIDEASLAAMRAAFANELSSFAPPEKNTVYRGPEDYRKAELEKQKRIKIAQALKNRSGIVAFKESPDGVNPTTKMFLEEPIDESPDGVNPSTKMFLESDNESVVYEFISYVCDRLGIVQQPKIILHTDPAWSEQTQSFGRYNPDSHTLEVNLANRHIMDILRTVAHELVHCRQNQQHPLPDSAGETGSDWENQANAMAGVIMRDYADAHAEQFADNSLAEATGYIPKNKKQAQDPRFSMAISPDVHPGQVGTEANKMALHTGPNGEPGLLMKTVNLRESIEEASYEGNIGAMETFKFYQQATPKQKITLKQLLADGDYTQAWKLIQQVTDTQLVGREFAESMEHANKLDSVLARCIQMITHGQKTDPERYGRVAACLIDSQGHHTYAINLPGQAGTRRHAERVAINKHLKRYKEIGPGAVMVTTLSPCVNHMSERYGEDCADLLADAGIERCYAGYQDPTQQPDVDYPFELEVTNNADIFNTCKQIAQSFLPKVIAQDNTGDQLAEGPQQSITVYHGNQGGLHGKLITPMWWSEDKDTAVYYATQFGGDGTVFTATLSCENPYVITDKDETNTMVEKYKTLAQQGHDSIYDPRGHDWIPFYNKDIHITDKEYLDGQEQGMAEAFDQPYRTKSEKSDYGDIDMLAKLPDGTNLSIMFNNQGDDEWQVEFYRDNSQEVTGGGDAQRVFATVLTSMQKFIKKYKPWRLTFSANKDVQPGQNSESRAKLYNRLVQRYAAAWGYEEYSEDHGDQITYELTQLKPGVAEGKLNFEEGDCPIFAIALHRLSKMPLMALVEYDDQMGSTVLIHAYVKLDDRWRLDASGETDVDWMLQRYPNNGHAEEIEISEKDLLELGYGKSKCPTLQQVLPHAKEVLQNIEEDQQGMAEDVENFNGIDVAMEIEGDEIMVRATAGGRELGHVLFVEEGEYLMPQDLEVDERFQGQGIAAAMYDYVKSKGYRIRRSGQQTDAGAGFWGKHRPEQNIWEQGMAEDVENFVSEDAMMGKLEDSGKIIRILKKAHTVPFSDEKNW